MESSLQRAGRWWPWRKLTPRWALIAVAWAVMAFGAGAWSLYLWSDYRSTLDAAYARGQASLDALSEHTKRLVVTNDLLLHQMLEMLQDSGAELFQTSELAWRTVRALADLPQQSVALGVIDHTGKFVINSRSFAPLPDEAATAPAEIFEIHQNGKHEGLLIGPTLFSQIDNRPFLTFSRRWDGPDGSFRGVIVSGVNADDFLAFADRLAFGPKSTLSIIRDDGLVLIRRPLTPEVTRLRLQDYKLFTEHLAQAQEGSYQAVSPADGARRMVFYRKLDELPLIMIAGLANDDILARWQRRAFQTAVLVVLAFGAIGALTAIGVVHADRETRALQQLRAAREHERLLVAEVDHRSRNLLSIIEAQIRQTARHSGDRHELARKLSGRVHALATAHELLSAEKWKEVDVRSLIEREMVPFCVGNQMAICGDSVPVAPKVAMSLAVVLHELATNATKYGALSVPTGRVDISWRMDEAGQNLKIWWRETGGPAVEPPTRKGFGTTLIERSLPHDLGGSVSLRFPADGLQAEFTIPLAPAAH